MHIYIYPDLANASLLKRNSAIGQYRKRQFVEREKRESANDNGGKKINEMMPVIKLTTSQRFCKTQFARRVFRVKLHAWGEKLVHPTRSANRGRIRRFTSFAVWSSINRNVDGPMVKCLLTVVDVFSTYLKASEQLHGHRTPVFRRAIIRPII